MDQDLAGLARAIVDANLYMTLGTAGTDGRPWTTPVYFASTDYTRFYWVSSTDTVHSRNIGVRAQVSIVIFDSQVRPYAGRAVYIAAEAAELTGDELEDGLAVYPGPPERGATAVSIEDVTPPAPYRLYCATASELSVLCPREPRQPCSLHGLSVDHRASVAL